MLKYIKKKDIIFFLIFQYKDRQKKCKEKKRERKNNIKKNRKI